MKEFGIDISVYQGNFNFDAAVNEGVKFVIVKGGGGDDGFYKDRLFEQNYVACKAKNLPIGWGIEKKNNTIYFYPEPK